MYETNYSVVYTPKGTSRKLMHETREFEENIKSKAKAIRMAEKAVKEGHYNIFVDKYEYDKEIDCNDLIMSWSFGKHY